MTALTHHLPRTLLIGLALYLHVVWVLFPEAV